MIKNLEDAAMVIDEKNGWTTNPHNLDSWQINTNIEKKSASHQILCYLFIIGRFVEVKVGRKVLYLIIDLIVLNEAPIEEFDNEEWFVEECLSELVVFEFLHRYSGIGIAFLDIFNLFVQIVNCFVLEILLQI